jgi:hypothetical protein
LLSACDQKRYLFQYMSSRQAPASFRLQRNYLTHVRGGHPMQTVFRP